MKHPLPNPKTLVFTAAATTDVVKNLIALGFPPAVAIRTVTFAFFLGGPAYPREAVR